MRHTESNSSRKLMQELESAIQDLKEIQRKRDELVAYFKSEKDNIEQKDKNKLPRVQ